MPTSCLHEPRWIARLWVATLAALWLLTAPMVAAQDCVVTVEPSSGTVGTEFVVTGSGFNVRHGVSIFRNGTHVSRHEVEPQGENGTWTLEVTADAAGTWEATAVEPEGCGAEDTFTVLANTSTETDARISAASGSGNVAPLLAAATLGLLLGLARLSRKVSR